MFYFLIYALMFFGVTSAVVYLAGLFQLIRLTWPIALSLLPGLIFGVMTADVFLLGPIVFGQFLPSPMVIYFLFGGMLMIPINLLLAYLFLSAVWKISKQRR